ncbi:hypothetical protein QP932_10690 [Corynebacterium freneyi]|uniref:hypothetical protein n=1 Tax=Corynebacterium freneyi TaxID=134034 RepID=UPI00254B6D31|nr:hypothetical protein [Corynebacterium freneyi]MDK8768958.1 hypothetical protein [Corynebacterium freneyi]
MADILCERCGAPAVEVIIREWTSDQPVCARCSAVAMRSMVIHGVKSAGVRRIERVGRHAVIGEMIAKI